MKKRKLYLIIVGILLVVALMTGVSYALWMKTFSQTGNNTVASDCFNISFLEDTTSNIKLENTFPIRDNEGMNLKPYTFSVTNKCSNEVSYEINLETTTNTTMKDSYVKIIMGENNPKLLTSYVNGNKTLSNGKSSYVLESGNLSGNTTNSYKIRIWMDENVTQDMENAMNSVFESKITVTGTYIKNYHESILNGTDPVLKDNLIPVTISDDGTVRKADIRKEWYNYQNKNWANAVITKDSYSMLNESGKVHGATKNIDSVSFDGVDDYIDLGLQNYDFKNQITMAVQMRLNDINTKIRIGNWEGAGGGFWANTPQLQYELFFEESNSYIGGKWDQELNTTDYYTFVLTYDGVALKLYANGNLVSETPFVGEIKPSIMPIFIGANPDVLNHIDFSNINVKQTAIFNRSLSAEEIKKDMSADIKITNAQGLLSYTDFTNQEYQDNEIIPESNIESYFVWIPRYKYQIFNDGNYTGLTTAENRTQEIKIIFENKNTTISNGSTIGSWLTHPAFTSFDTNGMWVGKYETGYKGAKTTTEAQQNVNDSSKVQIKPNVYSWRNIQVSNAHLNSYNYQRNLDSHIMKNTEWGAVAYLQHSNYGSKQSVRLNNNNSYITGYAAISEPTCGYTGTNEDCNRYDTTIPNTDGTYTKRYNSPTGYLASTTGNISGVYDMSGGAWEYTFGVVLDKNGNPISGRNNIINSGFNGIYGCPGCDSDTSGKTELTTGINYPDEKYYDAYSYSENLESYQGRILGDATGEMGPFAAVTYNTKNRKIGSWYNDEAWFLNKDRPLIMRGYAANFGTGTGIFSFGFASGNSDNFISYRIVLAF